MSKLNALVFYRGLLSVALMFAACGIGRSAPSDDYATCQQTDDIDKSIAACSRIIEDTGTENGDRATMYLRRGYGYFTQGNDERALIDYTRSIELQPQDVFAYANRAIVYERMRDRSRALADVRKAREMNVDQFAALVQSSEDLKELARLTEPSHQNSSPSAIPASGRGSLLITIAPGSTSEQIVAQLDGQAGLSGTIGDIPPPEGALLPGSYHFEPGTDRKAAEEDIERAATQALADVWSGRDPDLPLKSPRDLLTLASIVEKETPRLDERPRLARVFVNRLARHMRLQSDATLIYGLVGGKGSLGHAITKAELQTPTPYNTYVVDGLPPGPIANPSRASLEAAAHPPKAGEIYFTPDGTGSLAFASTIEEHQRNVARWRSVERTRK